MAIKYGVAKINNDSMQKTMLRIPSSVEVKESIGEAISYTIVFAEDVCEEDFELVNDPNYAPGADLVIWVELEDKEGGKSKEYLVNGPVQNQQIKLINGGQGSQLQVTGFDLSYKMKLDEKPLVHSNVTDADIVTNILNNYGFQNSQVTDQKLRNNEKHHSRLQNQDDLTFMKSMARDYGLFLWMSFDEDGDATAHFSELPLDSNPQEPYLIINNKDVTKNNIDDLTITWNTDVPTKVVGSQIDTKTKKPVNPEVDGSPQTKLGKYSLKDINAKQPQKARSSHRPADDTGHAQQRSEGALNQAEWFIQASCSTSFDRLCGILHAHTLVLVQGAGTRHSGKYLVKGITHSIDASSYKMQIQLARNAWN